MQVFKSEFAEHLLNAFIFINCFVFFFLLLVDRNQFCLSFSLSIRCYICYMFISLSRINFQQHSVLIHSSFYMVFKLITPHLSNAINSHHNNSIVSMSKKEIITIFNKIGITKKLRYRRRDNFLINISSKFNIHQLFGLFYSGSIFLDSVH